MCWCKWIGIEYWPDKCDEQENYNWRNWVVLLFYCLSVINLFLVEVTFHYSVCILLLYSAHLKIHVFWNMTLCPWAGCSWHFGGLWCLQNVGKCAPNDMASRRSRLESSATLLWEFKILNHLYSFASFACWSSYPWITCKF
jgi:hypothetical protein